MLRWSDTDLCLAIMMGEVDLGLASCDQESLMQKWYFTHYNPGGLPYTDLAH